MKQDEPFTKLLKRMGQIPPTLSEFISASGDISLELTPQLVWEAATKLYGKVAGEGVCPPTICRFVAELVRANQANDVLDPFVGYGTLLGTVYDVVRPRSLVAVSANPSVLEAARCLLARIKGATFRIGDVHGEALEPVGPADVVVSAPPFNLPARTFSLDGTELHDHGGHELLLRSCLHLRNPGVGVFVVSPRILAGRSGRGVLSALQRFDLHLDAYFHVPSGAFAPLTMIETAIVVIRRGRSPGTMFVGELVEDDAAQATLLENYAERARGGTPKLGALVPIDEFRSVARLEFDERTDRISRELDLRAVTLGELADTIERCPNAAEELDFRPNTLFIPLGVAADATADVSVLPSRLRDVVQVVLRPDVADARIVAGFLNSPLGRELRTSRATGTTPKRLQLPDLAELPVWLPDLQAQREVVRVDQEIGQETERLRELKHALWSRMNPSGLAAVVQASTHEDSYLGWVDSLPFPLASILWSHHTLSEPTKRYERLLFFFEALAQFLATLVLSGARRDQAFFTNEWKAIRERLVAQNVPLERATFGTWVIVFEILAKSIRREAARDEDARAHWCNLLAIDEWSLVEALISSKMVALLKEANQLRNMARHGGAISERESEYRESLLSSSVLKFRQLVGTRWNTAPLVLPRHSRYTRGSHHTSVQLVMGTRSPFQQQEYSLRHPLEDGDLHIIGSRSGSTCRLLPFVQMGSSPRSEPTACYFFSRRQGELMRFVSYHFDTQSEIQEMSPAVQDALDELEL